MGDLKTITLLDFILPLFSSYSRISSSYCFLALFILLKSRDSSVGIALGYGLDFLF
jgi:hypothetical protein